MGSGLIYLFIIGVWAAVLVPMWLRRHEAAYESRSVDRFSHAMRSLARRPATPDQREIVMPARARADVAHLVSAKDAWQASRWTRAARPAAPGRATTGAAPVGRRPSPSTFRRRRTVAALLALTLLGGILGAAGLAPAWSPLAPTGALLVYVALLRHQLRRSVSRGTVRGDLAGTPAPVRAQTSRAQTSRAVEPLSTGWAADPVYVSARSAGSPAAAPRTASARALATGTDPGWRPTPVPLPTYITKPKAMPPLRTGGFASASADVRPGFDQDPVFDQEAGVLAEPVADRPARVDRQPGAGSSFSGRHVDLEEPGPPYADEPTIEVLELSAILEQRAVNG